MARASNRLKTAQRSRSSKAAARQPQEAAKGGLRFDERPVLSDYDRARVLFRAHDGDTPVRCAVTVDALQAHFDMRGFNPLVAEMKFKQNRDVIQAAAARKYAARKLEPDGLVLVTAQDI